MSKSAAERTAAWVGKRVVIHSAPTAWIGTLVSSGGRDGHMWAQLTQANLWIRGDLVHMSQEFRDPESPLLDVEIPVVTAMWIMPDKPMKPWPVKKGP